MQTNDLQTMRTKILSALKTEYKHLGLGDKAFDGVAAYLAKTVKDGDDITNLVKGEDVKALVTAIQGESDTLRTQNADLKRQLDAAKKTPVQTDDPDKKPDNPDGDLDAVKAMLKKVLDKQAALDAELKQRDIREKHASLKREADKLLRGGGSNNDFLRNLALSKVEISDTDTATTIAERCKGIYDTDYKELFGSGQMPPKSAGRVVEGYKKGDFKEEVDRLKNRGVISSE